MRFLDLELMLQWAETLLEVWERGECILHVNGHEFLEPRGHSVIGTIMPYSSTKKKNVYILIH